MQLLLPLPGEQWGSGHTQQLGDMCGPGMKMDLSLEPSASLLSCPQAPLTEGSTLHFLLRWSTALKLHPTFFSHRMYFQAVGQSNLKAAKSQARVNGWANG